MQEGTKKAWRQRNRRQRRGRKATAGVREQRQRLFKSFLKKEYVWEERVGLRHRLESHWQGCPKKQIVKGFQNTTQLQEKGYQPVSLFIFPSFCLFYPFTCCDIHSPKCKIGPHVRIKKEHLKISHGQVWTLLLLTVSRLHNCYCDLLSENIPSLKCQAKWK